MKIQIGGFSATYDWEIAIEGAGFLWALNHLPSTPISPDASEAAFHTAFLKDTEFEDDLPDEAIRGAMWDAWERGIEKSSTVLRAGALISVMQAADIAKVSRRYILDEIEAKRLAAGKIGRGYAILSEDFKKWQENPARGSRRKKSK